MLGRDIMSDRHSVKKSGSDRRQRRALLGATMIAVIVIDAVTVGILIGTKGVVPSLPAITGGTVFIITLVLYWFRSEKDDADADEHCK